MPLLVVSLDVDILIPWPRKQCHSPYIFDNSYHGSNCNNHVAMLESISIQHRSWVATLMVQINSLLVGQFNNTKFSIFSMISLHEPVTSIKIIASPLQPYWLLISRCNHLQTINCVTRIQHKQLHQHIDINIMRCPFQNCTHIFLTAYYSFHNFDMYTNSEQFISNWLHQMICQPLTLTLARTSPSESPWLTHTFLICLSP